MTTGHGRGIKNVGCSVGPASINHLTRSLHSCNVHVMLVFIHHTYIGAKMNCKLEVVN
jgi:hypothetical protein